jgi:hypothetical protein
LLCGFGAPGTALLLCAALLVFVVLKRHTVLPTVSLALGAALSAAALLLSPHDLTFSTVLQQFNVSGLLSLSVWFLWPLWFIVAFGVWRLSRNKRTQAKAGDIPDVEPAIRWPWHFAAPMLVFVLLLIVAAFSATQDAALFPALPALAIAAALMLALMPRSVLAAVDWFALALFTGAAAFLWVLWLAAQTGVPAPISGNIERFYPGFREAGVWPFQELPFTFAASATLCWLALMFWRTSRARKPLWKGMVLTAGGVTLTWLLLQTLGAPVLNASRSYAAVVKTIDASIPPTACITPINIPDAHQFVLRYGSRSSYSTTQACGYALVRHSRTQSPYDFLPRDGWALLWSVRRPSEREEIFSLFNKISEANKLESKQSSP